MLFIDSPSQLASIEKWQDYLKRLNSLNPNDKTVIGEKKRAQIMIKLLREEDDKDKFA